MTQKQSNQEWADRVKNEFVPGLDGIAAEDLRQYIEIVEKHGAKLILRSENDSDVYVTYRNGELEIMPA